MIADTTMKDKSSILLIYTGGTIGMKEDPSIQALRTFDFRQILEEVPVESANTMQVDMNGDFICVHALATGEFDFKLPFLAKVINLKTAIPAETEGNMLKLNLVAGQTVWFEIVR